jgi:hypothetical protein
MWWLVGRCRSHEKTKHKLADQNKASSNSISNYLSRKNISKIEKQLSLAPQLQIHGLHYHYREETFQE